MTSKQKLTCFVILYAIANLALHTQIDRSGPGSSASLHIAFAMVALVLTMGASVTYGVRRQVAVSGPTTSNRD